MVSHCSVFSVNIDISLVTGASNASKMSYSQKKEAALKDVNAKKEWD